MVIGGGGDEDPDCMEAVVIAERRTMTDGRKKRDNHVIKFGSQLHDQQNP